MLSTDQKVTVLRKAGIPVPPFPARRLTVLEDGGITLDELEADVQQRAKEWKKTINALYLECVPQERNEREIGFDGAITMRRAPADCRTSNGLNGLGR